MTPSRAVVAVAVLNVRRRPRHNSELTSQMLLGETLVRLGASRDGAWWRVRGETDGYVGWVRSWGLVPVSAARATRWAQLARGRVSATITEARDRTGGALIMPLVWNARVIVRRRQGRMRSIVLPDGRSALSPATAIVPAGRRSLGIAARVRSLIGTPYLWGGRSPFGFDCSGLTQQILGEQGISVPRDARQQYRAARRLTGRETPCEGDLAFFADRDGSPGHVGLLLGGGYYVQARGRVRVNSLDPDNPLYDNDLDGTFLGIRRPRPRASETA